MTRRMISLAAVVGLLTSFAVAGTASAAGPDLGPNVLVFDPSMPTSQIQAAVDAVATQQVSNQFGTQRYALLFKPGTYGSATDPLNFQVGYYTAVAGLGRSPNDVVINGSVYVRNQCDGGSCVALNNFWRSLSNLTINVTTPGFGCYSGEFWAVSQAAPMRRVHVNGLTTLMDYCTGPSFASGGFIADSAFDGSTVINGSQQQWLVRNSTLDGWTNGVWNQVFSGVVGAPAQCFPGVGERLRPVHHARRRARSPARRPTSTSTPPAGYSVFVPAVQHDAVGTTWGSGPTPGSSIPIDDFFIARPSDDAQAINNALSEAGTSSSRPASTSSTRTIKVKRAGTVVLGLGFPTLVPTGGDATMTVADVTGVKLAGLLFDAGPEELARSCSRWATRTRTRAIPADPTTLSDVFFRIGGATPGKATTSLVVNSDDVILDDIWAWRADHGNGVGWTANTADTGVIVNGDNVTAYGLFVEHYQQYETIWNGQDGRVVFFQNEMPYDPPSQAAWTEAPGVPGWAAFKIADRVTSFRGYGMGSYSFFNQGMDIFAANAFEVPDTLPPGSLNDLLTIFLDPANGKGGILNVINGTGGSSTIANPDVPVTVVSYP